MNLSLWIFLAFLAGCSLKPKLSCDSQNWLEQGRLDGEQGKGALEFQSHKKSCPSADLNQYSEGRAQGLKKYCSYQSGFQLAMTKKDPEALCPNEWNTDYQKGYQDGKQKFIQERRKQELKNLSGE